MKNTTNKKLLIFAIFISIFPVNLVNAQTPYVIDWGVDKTTFSIVYDNLAVIPQSDDYTYLCIFNGLNDFTFVSRTPFTNPIGEIVNFNDNNLLSNTNYFITTSNQNLSVSNVCESAEQDAISGTEPDFGDSGWLYFETNENTEIQCVSVQTGFTLGPFTANFTQCEVEIQSNFPLRIYLFAPEGQQTASFTTPMLASVISGVQNTGQNLWPLFVFVGIPLAFIIGLQLIVFTKRSFIVEKFDDDKADELEEFFSKTGGTDKNELETIKKIERKR